METYCLTSRKKTKNIVQEISSTSNGKSMILLKCPICGGKKSEFITNRKAKGLLSNLGIGTPLNKVPILHNILF